MLLGKRLKELRIKEGLTQRELGEKINVTKVSICCYESGTRTPTLETLFELAKVFEVDLNYLLGSDQKVKGSTGKGLIMADEEIQFIEELRNHQNVYDLMIENPKRCAELMSKKLR